MRTLFVIAAAVFFAILIGGFREVDVYSPIIFKMCDPNLFSNGASLLSNDLINGLVKNGTSYNSVFFVIEAFVARHSDLFAFNFAGYVAVLMLFFWGIFRLSKTIFNSDAVAYISILLLVVVKDGLAGGLTFRNEFDHSNIAMTAALFSIERFFKQRHVASFILLSFAFIFHPYTAIWSLGFLLSTLLYDLSLREIDVAKVNQIVFPVVIFSLVVSCYVFLNLDDMIRLLANPEPQLWAILTARAPHHYVPHTWTSRVVAYAPIFILIVIAIISSVKTAGGREGLLKKKIGICLLVSFSLYVAAEIVFTEIYPVFLIARLQPIRFTSFVSIIGAMYVAQYIYCLYEEAGGFFVDILNCAIMSAIVVSFFGYNLVDAALAWAIIPLGFAKAISLEKTKSYLVGLLGLTAAAIFMRWGSFNALDCVLVLLSGIVLYSRAYLVRRGYIGIRVGEAFLGVALLVFLSFESARITSRLEDITLEGRRYLAPLIFKRPHDWLRRINVPYLTPRYLTPRSDYIEIQLWAEKNTAINSMFLVPPMEPQFRVYSKRPIFGDWEFGGNYFANKELAYEWYRRMNLLGIFSEHDEGKYSLLDEGKLAEICSAYDISYAVFHKPNSLRLPVAFETARYIVYDLKRWHRGRAPRQVLLPHRPAQLIGHRALRIP